MNDKIKWFFTSPECSGLGSRYDGWSPFVRMLFLIPFSVFAIVHLVGLIVFLATDKFILF